MELLMESWGTASLPNQAYLQVRQPNLVFGSPLLFALGSMGCVDIVKVVAP
jgi:hypothetical protein